MLWPGRAPSPTCFRVFRLKSRIGRADRRPMQRLRSLASPRSPAETLQLTTQGVFLLALGGFAAWLALGPFPVVQDPLMVAPSLGASFIWIVGGAVLLVGLAQALVYSRALTRPFWTWRDVLGQLPRVVALAVTAAAGLVTVDALVFSDLTATTELSPGQWVEVQARLSMVDPGSVLTCLVTGLCLWGLAASTRGLSGRLCAGWAVRGSR